MTKLTLDDIMDMLPSLYGTGWEYSTGGTTTMIDGTKKSYKDAFIVIKKRQDVISSNPPQESSND